MDSVTAADLLAVWERGRSASPGERGLLLLRLAQPVADDRELGDWSAGHRDATLLELRERVFGPSLSMLTSCRACGESLELDVPVAEMLVPGSDPPPQPLSLSEGSYRVRFRLPSAGDLAALGAAEEDGVDERWLLERCIVEASESGTPRPGSELPDDVLEAVASAMASADPQAELEVSLDCPACGEVFSSRFDIVSFLWQEVDSQAERLLREVAMLASAFGWSEREVLSMSAWRRAWYVGLVGG